MVEKTSIFDVIEDTEKARKKKKYLIRVRTAQVTTLLLSLALIFVTCPTSLYDDAIDTGAFIISLLCLTLSLFSFKWPFSFLLAYSIVSIGLLTIFIVFVIFNLENILDKDTTTEIIFINVLCLSLILLIIRGTTAARKYATC